MTNFVNNVITGCNNTAANRDNINFVCSDAAVGRSDTPFGRDDTPFG